MAGRLALVLVLAVIVYWLLDHSCRQPYCGLI